MSNKNLNLYENLGLHHSPKVFPQQVWTLNLSLLRPSQPSSYNPDTYFEACICIELSMHLKSNLYPDYYKTSLKLHTNELNVLPYLSSTTAVGLQCPIFTHQLNSQPFSTYCHKTLPLRLWPCLDPSITTLELHHVNT